MFSQFLDVFYAFHTYCYVDCPQNWIKMLDGMEKGGVNLRALTGYLVVDVTWDTRRDTEVEKTLRLFGKMCTMSQICQPHRLYINSTTCGSQYSILGELCKVCGGWFKKFLGIRFEPTRNFGGG